jgi:hypothetical protein
MKKTRESKLSWDCPLNLTYFSLLNRAGGFARLESELGFFRRRSIRNLQTKSLRNVCFCRVVDPNSKESESFSWIRIRIRKKNSDLDSDTVVEWKFMWKIEDQTFQREKSYVFLLNIFFLSDVQVPEHIWKQLEAPFRKIWGQNSSLKIRIRKQILWIQFLVFRQGKVNQH